jgi:hypothetical protein
MWSVVVGRVPVHIQITVHDLEYTFLTPTKTSSTHTIPKHNNSATITTPAYLSCQQQHPCTPVDTLSPHSTVRVCHHHCWLHCLTVRINFATTPNVRFSNLQPLSRRVEPRLTARALTAGAGGNLQTDWLGCYLNNGAETNSSSSTAGLGGKLGLTLAEEQWMSGGRGKELCRGVLERICFTVLSEYYYGDGRGMWHIQGRGEINTGAWCENRGKVATWKT